MSGKIGGIQFYKVIVAAYVLEEIYTEGVAVATIDGSPVTSWGYVGWSVLFSCLDEAIDDMENGRVYSEEEVFAELDAI